MFVRIARLLAAVALIAAGCSGDSDESGSASSPSATLGDAVGAESDPSESASASIDATPTTEADVPDTEPPPELRARDQRGVEVVLDAPPQRVVSVWDSIDAQNLLALGVEPILIGRVNGGRPAPWLDDYAGIETYDLGAGPSIELLATYQPDLIVTASYDPASYELLEGVAPLYVADNSIPWRDELRSLAQLVGRQAEAEALIEDHERAIGAAAAALEDWQGRTLLAAAVSPQGELTAFTDRSPISALLEELGMAPLVAAADGNATQSYSFELVGQLEADAFLLVDVTGLAGFDLETVNVDFLSGPIVGTIPAARGGIYRISPASSAALRLVNAANLPYLLDELVESLTGEPVQ